ncbi:hypothetical protein [Leptothermofonsia sp. ETS-13]|uniref:hypothetical protein n=1 Tax=Leptothermofonsia sp. ETS-13 TaxID=3035696 RepID=UPI003B9F860E
MEQFFNLGNFGAGASKKGTFADQEKLRQGESSKNKLIKCLPCGLPARKDTDNSPLLIKKRFPINAIHKLILKSVVYNTISSYLARVDLFILVVLDADSVSTR